MSRVCETPSSREAGLDDDAGVYRMVVNGCIALGWLLDSGVFGACRLEIDKSHLVWEGGSICRSNAKRCASLTGA